MINEEGRGSDDLCTGSVVQLDGDTIELNLDPVLSASVLRAFAGTTPLDAAIDRLEPPSRPVSIRLSILLIRWYRLRVAPRLGQRCVFEPSCSRYAELVLRKTGLWRGLCLIGNRLWRCRPEYGGVDMPEGITLEDLAYKIEPIGAQFSNKELPKLAERFTQQANEGYELHSVFQVSQPGCLGVGQPRSVHLFDWCVGKPAPACTARQARCPAPCLDRAPRARRCIDRSASDDRHSHRCLKVSWDGHFGGGSRYQDQDTGIRRKMIADD